MSDISQKRFIAGATCPACAALDTVYTYIQDGEKWRACTRCDLRESLGDTVAAEEELPTRVNQPRSGEPVLAHETPVEKVRLVDKE